MPKLAPIDYHIKLDGVRKNLLVSLLEGKRLTLTAIDTKLMPFPQHHECKCKYFIQILPRCFR